MNQQSQETKEEDRKKIITNIKRRIAIKRFHGRVYWMLNDYFYAIAWTITMVTPFAFAAVLYLPDVKDQLALIMLVATSIATLMSLIRSVFRLGERAKHVLQQKAEAEFLMNSYSLELITDEALVEGLKKLDLSDIDEPSPI